MTFLLIACISFAGCASRNGLTISPPPTPEQFVLAYTRAASGGTFQIETRLSVDGTAWSLPSVVPTAAGSPVAVHASGVSPGLATDGRVYLIAWFDPAGILNTRFSSDGWNWTGGSTYGGPQPVDNQSRPSLAVGAGRWIAAIRLRNSALVVQPLIGSSTFIRLLDGTTQPAVPVRSIEAPALAYGDGRFVLAYIDVPSGTLRTLVSSDGLTWSNAPGMPVPFPSGVTPPSSSPPLLAGMDGAPYLTFGIDNIFHLAATRVIRRGGTLSRGQILIHRSPTGMAWSFAIGTDLIEPSTPVPAGIGIAGPATGQVIVEPTPHSGTPPDVFVNGTELDPSPLAPGAIVASPVSLVHGPRRIDIRNLRIDFSRFKRLPDPGLSAGGQTEDVTLDVRHVNASGALVKKMAPWTVQNATLRQQHFWSEGHGVEQPQFLSLMQPGDTITVSVTGKDGTVTKGLTFAGIVTGPDCARGQIDVDQPTRSFSYIVFYSCGVVPQSSP